MSETKPAAVETTAPVRAPDVDEVETPAEPDELMLVEDIETPADPDALLLVEEAVAFEHFTAVKSASSDLLVASPGCETPVVQRGVLAVLASHTQHGSPSSWPFV
jgi:hypothetical protein